MTRNPYFKKFRTPVRVDKELTKVMHNNLAMFGIEVPGQWKMFVTDTKRGRAACASETITIPTWALETDKPGYEIWYACHEIAHITGKSYIPGRMPHGPEFMAALIDICPEEFLHYELGYKPRNAATAGITQKEAQ